MSMTNQAIIEALKNTKPVIEMQDESNANTSFLINDNCNKESAQS